MHSRTRISENVWEWATELANRIRALNDQLYLQGTAMFELIWQVMEHATTYHAQRQSTELSAFHWIIDAKDKGRATEWETLWSDIVMPVLQTRSITRPHAMLEGADYSHFKRFKMDPPDWLPRPAEGHERTVTNLRLVLMENFRRSSDAEPGLELADIVTNAARRALSGTLQRDGWRHLPSLMIHRRQHYIQLVALHDRKPPKALPYGRILLKHFRHGGRSMIAPRWQSESE